MEQILSLALEVGDYFYVLSRGFVAFEGTSEELLAREDVIAEHLGVGRVKEALRSRESIAAPRRNNRTARVALNMK